MDPITAALIGTAILGAGGGIAGTFQNNQMQRYNKEQLEQLLALKEQDKLGMSGEQQRVLGQQIVDPVRQAADAARRRNEQVMGAMGGGSGADLARLRQEQASGVGAAAQNAALQITALNEAAKNAQLREIDQRMALKGGLRADDFGSVMGGLGTSAAALGQAAGAPPGTTQLSGLFGQAGGAAMQRAMSPGVQRDIASGLATNVPEAMSGSDVTKLIASKLSPQEQAGLYTWAAQNPEEWNRLLGELGYGAF